MFQANLSFTEIRPSLHTTACTLQSTQLTKIIDKSNTRSLTTATEPCVL